MQFQSYYNRFLLSLEGTKNIYVSFCENIISFCAPRTFRFADYKSSTGKQRYRCKHCQKRFITDYTYKAYLPNSDTKITQLTKEGLGIRSTARILGISLPPCLRRFCR